MLDQGQIDQLVGRDVHGSEGEKIGTARQVYTDDRTGEPVWATVRTGLFGLKESFVPLTEARMSGDRLVVPYAKDVVVDAPSIDEDGHLTPDQEQKLYAYYGRTDYEAVQGSYETGRTGRGNYEARRTGRGDFRPRDRDADSEDEASGRARLRKYVVVDQPAEDVSTERVEIEADATRGYN